MNDKVPLEGFSEEKISSTSTLSPTLLKFVGWIGLGSGSSDGPWPWLVTGIWLSFDFFRRLHEGEEVEFEGEKEFISTVPMTPTVFATAHLQLFGNAFANKLDKELPEEDN